MSHLVTFLTVSLFSLFSPAQRREINLFDQACYVLACTICLRDTSRTKRKSLNPEDSLWRYYRPLRGCFMAEVRLSLSEVVHGSSGNTCPWAVFLIKPAGSSVGIVVGWCTYPAGVRAVYSRVHLPGRREAVYGRVCITAGYPGGVCAEQCRSSPRRKEESMRRAVPSLSSKAVTHFLRNGIPLHEEVPLCHI